MVANTIATIAEPKGMAVSSVLAQFECLHSGFGASFQDFGRSGYRHLGAVSYTHLRAHETVLDLVCRLLLEKKTI